MTKTNKQKKSSHSYTYIITQKLRLSQKKHGARKWQQREKTIQFKLLTVGIGHDMKAYIRACEYVGSTCEKSWELPDRRAKHRIYRSD
jgi:hypothetical protein